MATKIKVIGVGGSGGNAVSRMTSCKIQGIDLIAINTDAQDLLKCKASQKIRIGRILTKGLGTGMNPEIGRLAAEENKGEIEEVLKGADMVFIACGLGGGTGSGAAPVIAEIAKNKGILTVAVVTKPFSFEGSQRAKVAKDALEQLKSRVDTLLVISNDKILSLIDNNATVVSALWSCDEVLRQAVQGISDLISVPGIINVDYADIKSIMRDAGIAIFGVGQAEGEQNVENAVKMAINSPLLNIPIEGAKGILFNISGGDDLSLSQIDEAAKIITQNISKEAKVIFGATKDKSLKKGEVKVTVLATGFATL
ncbi:MAG: cell division protein FtsZ [Candidatus Parcubacteria bacterium]|nr:cell division protein FtsZ [Candidatus Parcubacteria bacterium]